MEDFEEKYINENNLLEVGFVKQFEHRDDGYYCLNVGERFYLTVGFKNLTVSIHLVGYGHIEKLNHVKTIKQIQDLVFALTGKMTEETNKNEKEVESFAPKFEDHKYIFARTSVLQAPNFDYLRTLQLFNYV